MTVLLSFCDSVILFELYEVCMCLYEKRQILRSAFGNIERNFKLVFLPVDLETQTE
jgi:hypothetical protein